LLATGAGELGIGPGLVAHAIGASPGRQEKDQLQQWLEKFPAPDLASWRAPD
jgi:hypothetical protein